jgi:rhodanese-related sulfurtransferase
MRFRSIGNVVVALGVGVVVIGMAGWILWGQRVSFSPDEARQRIRDGKYDVIVDVRTPEEWQKRHREDAISVPIGEFITEFPKRVLDREGRVLIICRKGIRAEAAALMARKMGYTHVHYVEGDHDGLME